MLIKKLPLKDFFLKKDDNADCDKDLLEINQEEENYNGDVVDKDIIKVGENLEEEKSEYFQLTKAEIEQLKSEAFAEGKTEALQEFANLNNSKEQLISQERESDNTSQLALEEQIKEAVIRIDAQMSEISKHVQAILKGLSDQCLELALAIAKKIISSTIDYIPQKLVINFLQDKLYLLLEENNIEIIVHSKVYDYIVEYINNIKDSKLNAIIKISVDDKMGVADCKIDWRKGAFLKSSELLLQELSAMLKNYMDNNNQIY